VPDDFEYVTDDDNAPQLARRPRGKPWVRLLLAGLGVGFLVILGIAMWLNPYTADGNARTMATHTQLGLEPCSFVVITGKPCPACGMTTSFALLMHGDVSNSLKANWVGTLFCASLVPLAPWLILGAVRGRLWGVRNLELCSTMALSALLVLMMIRWAVLMLT